jgi:hypothetical protein
MTTIYDDALKIAWEEKSKDPEYAKAIFDVYTRMLSGSFNQKFLDMVFQKYRENYDIYDAYAFAQIGAGIFDGSIVTAEIDIGQSPHEDKAIEDNNRIISSVQNIGTLKDTKTGYQRTVGKVFQAEFWGGLESSDGYVKWAEPIYMLQQVDGTTTKSIEIPPGQIPLEVGYTSAARTMNHLGIERGLARWPYDSNIVTLLVVINEDYLMRPSLI